MLMNKLGLVPFYYLSKKLKVDITHAIASVKSFIGFSNV